MGYLLIGGSLRVPASGKGTLIDDVREEGAHGGGFSFRVVGEYPEARHPQAAHLPQGYSMCLKALISRNIKQYDALRANRSEG